MKTKQLIVSAVLIAIAAVLSFIQPFQLPFGGSVTLASSMPLIILSYIYGVKQGFFYSFVYSLLQIVLGLKTVSAFFLPGDSKLTFFAAVGVCLLDYIFAYSVLGFGGIFKNKLKTPAKEIFFGCLFAMILKYIIHIISGTIFFGSLATWFFTQDGFYSIGEKIVSSFSGYTLSLVYSIFYNGLYMLPEIIITALITPIAYNAVLKSKLS